MTQPPRNGQGDGRVSYNILHFYFGHDPQDHIPRESSRCKMSLSKSDTLTSSALFALRSRMLLSPALECPLLNKYQYFATRSEPSLRTFVRHVMRPPLELRPNRGNCWFLLFKYRSRFAYTFHIWPLSKTVNSIERAKLVHLCKSLDTILSRHTSQHSGA